MIQQIDIIGKSFCGSTLLCFILDSLSEGIRGIGELHSIFTTQEGSNTQAGMCCICWESCKYLTPDFLKDVTKDTLMSSIAEQLEAYTIVMANKDICFWMNSNIHGYNPEYILMFKRPEAQIKSFLSKHPKKLDIRSAINIYLDYYQLLAYLRGVRAAKGRRFLAVSYELFMQNPTYELRRICDFFAMPYVESALGYWNYDHHMIRGNGGPYTNLRVGDADIRCECANEERYQWYTEHLKQLRMDESWKEWLNDYQKRTIAECAEVQRLHNELLGLARIPTEYREGLATIQR